MFLCYYYYTYYVCSLRQINFLLLLLYTSTIFDKVTCLPLKFLLLLPHLPLPSSCEPFYRLALRPLVGLMHITELTRLGYMQHPQMRYSLGVTRKIETLLSSPTEANHLGLCTVTHALGVSPRGYYLGE